jgi:integrase
MTRRKAANGDGSITPRTTAAGKKVYDVRWTYRDAAGATRRGTRRGFNTRAAAAEFRRAVTSTVDAGSYIAPAKITLGEFLDTYLAGLRRSPQTVTGYRRKVRLHITPHLGHLPLGKVTAAHLNALYMTLAMEGSPGGRGPLAPATIREVHHIISGAYTAAIRQDLVLTSPTRKADPPTERQIKASRPAARVWAAADVAAFLRATAADRDAALWRLLITTGMRRGEALGLHWADVDLDHGRLAIRYSVGKDRPELEHADGSIRRTRQLICGPTKSNRPHNISLDPATIAAMRAHQNRQAVDRLTVGNRWCDRDLVFCRSGYRLPRNESAGGLLDPDRISVRFVQAVELAGLPRIRLHDLRHTWATLAQIGGIASDASFDELCDRCDCWQRRPVAIDACVVLRVNTPMMQDFPAGRCAGCHDASSVSVASAATLWRWMQAVGAPDMSITRDGRARPGNHRRRGQGIGSLRLSGPCSFSPCNAVGRSPRPVSAHSG